MRKYSDYLVIIKKKGKYRSYLNDKYILKYLRFLYKKNKDTYDSELEFLNSFHINYIVLDALEIMAEVSFKNNQYNTFKEEALLNTILYEMKKRVSILGRT